MKVLSSIVLAAATILPVSSALAGSCQNVHTWHQVNAKQGDWTVTLQVISENATFYKRSCQAFHTTALSPSQPLEYGFGFAAGADFDVAYTLTAVEKEKVPAFVSKSCVYVVTAKGPANPDIQAISYHGAKCDWKVVPGVGEDFSVA